MDDRRRRRRPLGDAGAGCVTDGGRLHGFQLWVNLPAADKLMRAPLPGVPARPHPGGARGRRTVRVIAGRHAGNVGPVETRTPVGYLHVTLEPGAAVTVAAPSRSDHDRLPRSPVRATVPCGCTATTVTRSRDEPQRRSRASTSSSPASRCGSRSPVRPVRDEHEGRDRAGHRRLPVGAVRRHRAQTPARDRAPHDDPGRRPPLPGGPRWHDGRLVFSDQHDGLVMRVGDARREARDRRRGAGLARRASAGARGPDARRVDGRSAAAAARRGRLEEVADLSATPRGTATTWSSTGRSRVRRQLRLRPRRRRSRPCRRASSGWTRTGR